MCLFLAFGEKKKRERREKEKGERRKKKNNGPGFKARRSEKKPEIIMGIIKVLCVYLYINKNYRSRNCVSVWGWVRTYLY